MTAAIDCLKRIKEVADQNPGLVAPQDWEVREIEIFIKPVGEEVFLAEDARSYPVRFIRWNDGTGLHLGVQLQVRVTDGVYLIPSAEMFQEILQTAVDDEFGMP